MVEPTVKILIMNGNTGALHRRRNCKKESKRTRIEFSGRTLVCYEESPGLDLQTWRKKKKEILISEIKTC